VEEIMLKSVRVPEPFEPPFARAESYVEKLFDDMSRTPEEGVLRIGGQRYVLVRCESLYLSWFEAMAETFGEETARDFIYNTAREIGRSDAFQVEVHAREIRFTARGDSACEFIMAPIDKLDAYEKGILERG
jgi:hypothetical protein